MIGFGGDELKMGIFITWWRRDVQERDAQFRCLDARTDRLLDGAAHTIADIVRRCSAEGLDSGAVSSRDLRNWSGADVLRELMRDLAEPRKRVRNAKDRLARMGL